MPIISPLLAIFIVGFGLAYFNGANDVSKGIATLVGSGVTNYRRAVAWGTLWTGIGAGLAAFTADAMLRTFNRVSLATGLHTTPIAIATMSGAILWIAFATLKGLPVSTTHAIVGAITADGQFIDANSVKDLAGLPSKNQLIAQVVATLLSPVHDVTNALSGNLHALLDGVADAAKA